MNHERWCNSTVNEIRKSNLDHGFRGKTDYTSVYGAAMLTADCKYVMNLVLCMCSRCVAALWWVDRTQITLAYPDIGAFVSE